MKATAKKERDACKEGAAAAGWTCEPHWTAHRDPSIGDETLPTPRQAMAAVIDDGEHRERLADVLWWYLSSVVHGTGWALMQATQEVQEPTREAPLRASLGTLARSVLIFGFAIALAYERAVDARARLFGWSLDDEWVDAVRELRERFGELQVAIEELQAKQTADPDDAA